MSPLAPLTPDCEEADGPRFFFLLLSAAQAGRRPSEAPVAIEVRRKWRRLYLFIACIDFDGLRSDPVTESGSLNWCNLCNVRRLWPVFRRLHADKSGSGR